MKYKRVLLLAVGAAVLALGVAGYAFVAHYRAASAPIGTRVSAGAMQFEVATTEPAMEKGLGGRADIPDNYGMLFVFRGPIKPGFWMKDMLASIDIVWLDAAGSIVLIDHSVSPATYPEVFYPPTPVSYVLETRAGYALDHGWDVGTKVPLPAPYGN